MSFPETSCATKYLRQWTVSNTEYLQFFEVFACIRKELRSKVTENLDEASLHPENKSALLTAEFRRGTRVY